MHSHIVIVENTGVQLLNKVIKISCLGVLNDDENNNKYDQSI